MEREQKIRKTLNVMAHICDPSTRENEARALLKAQGQPGLHNEIQTSQGYRVRALAQFLKQKENF